jgi:hypothetical protein
MDDKKRTEMLREALEKYEKVVIYGAGLITRDLLQKMDSKYKKSIIALIDNSKDKQNSSIKEIPIYSPNNIKKIRADCVIISVGNPNTSKEIFNALVDILPENFPILDLHGIYTTSPIVLYQMGKVGSMSILKSLHSLDLKNPLYHVHLLTSEWMLETTDYRLRNLTDKGIFLEQTYNEMIRFKYLRNHIKRGVPGGWKVITLVRDPIARNVSNFFHMIGSSYFFQNLEGQIGEDDTNNTFIETFFERYERHNEPLEWFDVEMKKMFNIDIYEKEFKCSQGYQIYNEQNMDLLLIRVEDLHHCIKQAMQDFLEIENFELFNDNVGTDKTYAPAYKKFKETIKFPHDYIERMYSSKFMRHFYTDAEIEKFKLKWC